VVFVRRHRRRLDLVRRGAGNDRSGGTEKQADKKQSYAFHRLRRFGYISHERTDPDVSERKYSGKAKFDEISGPTVVSRCALDEGCANCDPYRHLSAQPDSAARPGGELGKVFPVDRY
jgi:hypothetical protein